MIYDGILTKGFCREEFLKQMEQLRQITAKSTAAGKPPEGIGPLERITVLSGHPPTGEAESNEKIQGCV